MSSKTENRIFHCPLCCRKEFHSKKSLADHLSSVVLNLICPVCNVKHSSVESLADHLNCDECEATNSNENDQFHSQSATELTEHDKVSTDQDEIVTDIGNNTTGIQDNIPSQFVKLPPENIMEVNKFVQLLDKQMHKPCHETQEFKFVLEDRTRHYVYLPNEDVEQSLSENTIVTKQNNDGTISLTSLKAPKLESNPTLSAASDLESDENQKEIYTCNTCGVSFLSVIDHIQNFHNDQDVVVEEPLDDAAAANDETSNISETHRTLETTSPTNDKQTLRRMITETGDIIETPLIMKATEESKNTSTIAPLEYEIPVIDEAPKQKQAGKKENTNHNVKNNDEDKNGLYHKVVLQELVTSTGNKVKIYHCIICNIYVPTLAEFKSRPCAIVQPNKYACPHCPIVYDNSKSLCAHMKVHKTKEIVFDSVIKLNFECAICSTIFPTSKSLKLHKRMHDPIKSRPIEPPVPTKEGELMSEDKYMCSICNKLIPIDYRAIHQNSHMNSDTVNCHICNKKFTSREYLDMHMSVHNLDKVVVGKQDKSLPYTCVYCNRQFARPHEKVKHERIHTGEKPHSCEICGKSFRVSYCLTLHMRTHTGARPYACHHCGKRFKAHSVYNHHLLTHSEVRAYKCPYCPKAFKTSVQLAGHKNSHTKPFSCQQCNRPFASLYAVRVHMDSHAKSNSLKFACSLCGASYARAFALKDHVRQVHSDHLESAVKQEEWSLQDCDEDKESIQLVEIPDQEINELEMNADELIVS